MQIFTIRDIENLTGIKAHTLRIWEQRYPFFTSKRKESLHRFYDNEDLKLLLRVAWLYHAGWKISKIAALTQEQIAAEVRNAPVPEHCSQHVFKLLEAALDFNEAAFLQLFDSIQDQMGFDDFILQVCYPYLQKLGLLWSTNNVIPAQEHFSSYLIQNRVIAATGRLPHVHQQPQILLCCPAGEFHELPLLFINYLLRKNGKGTLYLGSNISMEEMLFFRDTASIKIIYLHLITNFTGLLAQEYLEQVCTYFPDKKIAASGEGFRDVSSVPSNLLLLQNNRQMEQFIRQLDMHIASDVVTGDALAR